MADGVTEAIKREIEPLWQRIDEQRREHRELEQQHGETRAQVKVLNSRMDTFAEAMDEHRKESRKGIEQLTKSVNDLRDEIRSTNVKQARAEGGMNKRELLAWSGLLITGVGLMLKLLGF
jgi:predicted RNase H-like nuclease (RuvC/YqgF family)